MLSNHFSYCIYWKWFFFLLYKIPISRIFFSLIYIWDFKIQKGQSHLLMNFDMLRWVFPQSCFNLVLTACLASFYASVWLLSTDSFVCKRHLAALALCASPWGFWCSKQDTRAKCRMPLKMYLSICLYMPFLQYNPLICVVLLDVC